MAIPIEFVKCSGAGNDFVLVDNMDGALEVEQAALAVALCSRPFGVGADGLLVLERSQKADFAMKYYNADGSYGGMCGNGGRCAAMYAWRRGLAGTEMRFEALDFLYEAGIDGGAVRLHMKDPVDYIPLLWLDTSFGSVKASFINTGSPHLIVRLPELEAVDVGGRGRELRFHERLGPAGANVNFVSVEDRSAIRLRTYERGVEGETLACGTGSVASAVVSTLLGVTDPPVKVSVRSGEALQVSFRKEGDRITNVTLQGSAHILFAGKAFYDLASRSLTFPVGGS